jgi:nitrate reductase assembly molybdenum cofactor insertion protein NarJ
MSVAISADAADLMRDAARWRLLSLLVERPTAEWHATLTDLNRECDDPSLDAIAAAAADASEGEYLAVFGAGGAVSPREIAHSPTRDPGRVLAELNAYYAAFAFHPLTEDPPDHLSVEVGFVAYLTLKRAYAQVGGDHEESEVTAQAIASFIERHLSTFAQPVADRLAIDPEFYLSQAAAAIATRTGPRRPDAAGGWTPEGLDEPLRCGGDCPDSDSDD